MFNIGAPELLVIVVVAVLVIGPKDMPLAMRTAGRWIGKIRRVSAHFRTGIDAMVREAELEEMEKKWKAQNEEIMRKSAVSSENDAGQPLMTGPPPVADPPRAIDLPEPQLENSAQPNPEDTSEPQLPLAPSQAKPKPDAASKADE